jgi:hypothetical protein
MNPVPYELAVTHREELLRRAAIRSLAKQMGSTPPAPIPTQRRRFVMELRAARRGVRLLGDPRRARPLAPRWGARRFSP